MLSGVHVIFMCCLTRTHLNPRKTNQVKFLIYNGSFLKWLPQLVGWYFVCRWLGFYKATFLHFKKYITKHWQLTHLWVFLNNLHFRDISKNRYFCVNICIVQETQSWFEFLCPVSFIFFLPTSTTHLCNEQKHLPSVNLVFLILLLNNHALCKALIDFFISNAFHKISYFCQLSLT